MAGDVRELCAELADLYTQLGEATVPDSPEAPDRSGRMRPALLWCTTHQVSHRRDQWQDVTTHAAAADWCTPGQDPRRASVLTAPALTPTAPRYSVRRRVPASSAPLDVGVLSAYREIGDVALILAREARHALGDLSREHDPLAALARLPMLLGRLGAGNPVTRMALGDGPREGVLARLRRMARYALELDRRPLTLAPCPSVQDDYLATWCGGYEPAAVWVDGVCRTFDAAASLRATQARREEFDAAVPTGVSPHRPWPTHPDRLRLPRERAWWDAAQALVWTSPIPRETPPVEIWRRSVLYVRDPDAPAGSDGAAVRCPGCGRVWRTAAELWQLHVLLREDDAGAVDPADSVRRLLYARIAAAMRAALVAGMAAGQGLTGV
jgi:hypothetical protein